MKCPKCAYLGFETGDRCKNCGYDFSLLAAAESYPVGVARGATFDDHGVRTLAVEPDYEFRSPSDDDVSIQVNADLNRCDSLEPPWTLSLKPESPHGDERISLGTPANPNAAAAPPAPSPVVQFVPSADALPLFTPSDGEDDEPLIRMPAAPRPPLAVRRALDASRLRAVPRPASGTSSAPVLQFLEEPPEAAPPTSAGPAADVTSGPGARLGAVVLDHAILIGIDLGVVYFTVRLAGLSMSEWRVLPLAPMLTFLGLLKVAYFYAFTAVGGQTIGKMAAGTCVIADHGGAVGAARAMRRTCAGVLSVLFLGVGFVPALFGRRRALHDRLAGTRVVRLRSV